MRGTALCGIAPSPDPRFTRATLSPEGERVMVTITLN